jgi:hypothetical protein
MSECVAELAQRYQAVDGRQRKFRSALRFVSHSGRSLHQGYTHSFILE